MRNNSSHLPLVDPMGRHLFNEEMGVSLTILGLLICLLDLIGNISVIHIVRTRTHMRSTTNLLIANLAAADLLMVIVVFYLTKHFYVGFRWFGGALGQVACKVILSIQPLSVVCSVLTLSAITVDRFFAIMYPLARFVTFTKTKRLIMLIWILSLVVSIPITFVSESTFYGKGYACYENWKEYGLTARPYVIAFGFISFVIPLVTMATLYSIMGVKLWKTSAPGYQTTRAMDRIKQGRRKAIKMLITVVVVFTLCWLPLHVAEFLKQFAPSVYWTVPFKLQWILPYFGILNSVANPFIYIVFCEKFRVEFASIFCFTKVVVTCSEEANGSCRSVQPTSLKPLRFRERWKHRSTTTTF